MRVGAGRVGLLVFLSLVVAMPGCGGCGADADQTEAEKKEKEAEEKAARDKKKKEEDPFLFQPLATLPPVADPQDRRRESPAFWYKPGHWIPTTLVGKANKEDFIGELELGLHAMTGGRLQPLGLEASPYHLTTFREISMPKGQVKSFDSVLYFPATAGSPLASCGINTRGGRRALPDLGTQLVRRMASYQCHLVVLSDVPERYSYLDALDSVKPPLGSMDDRTDPRGRYYLVSLIGSQAGRSPPLPAHALQWTAVACVLWDDADPAALSLNQQVALLDWLHWGGHLVLSGPKTLETLRASFLKDCLPATVPTDAPAARKLTARDFAEINRVWSRSLRGHPARPLAPVRDWEGADVKLHPEARFVPGTGDLVAERRVGRGRVVATLFRLSGKELTGWPHFDEFFNACVLGRPPRRFRRGPLEELQVDWAGGPGGQAGTHCFDAAVVCGLRYFTRDAGLSIREYGPDVLHAEREETMTPGAFAGAQFGQPAPPGAGVAAWNDFNDAARAARASLANSARIEIPDRSFVVWVVAVYLLVLVPANWAVFRALGRVEWAWAAAPAVAVLCTVMVVRLAQLDIGFARSVTEIGVLELQGDYPRGHLTRYTALYTSLSTGYRVTMTDPGGQVQPLPRSDVQSPAQYRRTGNSPLAYRHGAEVTVPGFQVQSNTTESLHSEQMIDLAGPLALARSELANRTGLTLRGAGVVRRTEAGELEAAWLGDLPPESVTEVRFRSVPAQTSGAQLWQEWRDRAPETASGALVGDFNFHALAAVAQDPRDLLPGQVRLIAWTEAEFAGLEIDPAAPQARRATLVVAHLGLGPARDPRPDAVPRAAVELAAPGPR